MNPSILSNEKLNEKYIRVCEGSLRVKIERGSVLLIEHFAIRKFPSFEAALSTAKAWRDKMHLEAFGYEVPKKVIHIISRTSRKEQNNPETGEPLPLLPAGISYGFHKSKLRYVVVSHQKDGKTIRTRFVIEKLSLEGAIKSAKEFRNTLLPPI